MIVAAFNPKGGVGKTTTAVNLAAVLARQGRSVVLVDLEADMNASISLGVRPSDATPSIFEALRRNRAYPDPVRRVRGIPRLHLITGSPALAGIEAVLRNMQRPERRLADTLRPLTARYDDVVIDSPAGYSTLNLSVPAIAEYLVVPTRAEYLSLESVAHLLRWYRDWGGRPGLASVAGILLTRVDYRRQATREIVDIIRSHNRRGVFATEIPEDPRVAEAPSHGVPLVEYTASRAARAYEAFASELLQRTARIRK